MKAMRSHPAAVRILRHALGGVAVALLVLSCGPGYTVPPVSPQLAKISPSPVSQLERGYSVHQAKCAKCHPFENPADYEAGELTREIMPVMARKAKLAPADAQAVLAYLLAARQLPPEAR